ncbi:MAG: hypothetical protein H8E21_10230 [Gammaproteobacteria bacterium]|nr:hypothetical protein [Gammaproteobacteria bacterium]MBL6998299.1 hypothetical protein [Gammaproteobacteria bacterium]
MLNRILTGLCITFLLVLQACSSTPLSPEDEIRQFIDNGIKAAENRSASDLSELIHDSYRDEKKLDKLQLRKLAQLYFFRHKSIFLFSKIREIKLHSKTQASVTLHVAMAGSVIADASMLSSLRARVYKFELELVKQDTWLLQQAAWQPANLGEMQ